MILVFSTEVGDSVANNPYNQGKPINTSEIKIPQKNKINRSIFLENILPRGQIGTLGHDLITLSWL